MEQSTDKIRDIFLSHRSIDKPMVRQIAQEIESNMFRDQKLLAWLDEGEIRFGQSITGLVNKGLEESRFFGIMMSPDYFQSESGWTDAEWHAALYADPDNRKARIIPILIKDCPYIPILLRHLRAVDCRGSRFREGLNELLSILRDEPLPRSVTHRGQLVTLAGKIERSTLIAERAIPDAEADPISEPLYCNLLPVQRLPEYVYTAPVIKTLRRSTEDGKQSIPPKQVIKEAIWDAQQRFAPEHRYMPSFRIVKDRIVTFHDLEYADGPLTPVTDEDDIELIPTIDFLRQEEDRKVLMSLVNMAISRHAIKAGLVADDTKINRFFFPAKDDGGPNIITWIPKIRRAQRTVSKPCTKDGRIEFWMHQGAYLQMLYLAQRLYLQISPTWIVTEDGRHPKGGPQVTRLINKWTGPERNLQVLYHVRFWTTILQRSNPGPIYVRAGDQRIELASKPAFVQQSHGIAGDQSDLDRLLDQEATLIAEQEEEIADLAADYAQVEIEDEETEEVDSVDQGSPTEE